MPELLTGTVTFLFSDIEGSTRLLQSQGEAWPALLERHQELIRAAVRAEGGREVGTEGDSFFVVFPTAPGAVSAAAAAQRALAAEPWPPGADVRVRMGLHTGEASLSAKTYVGLHVHRASRIASVGHGGQVLISDATRALLGQELPGGVELRDLGAHRLKDLEHPEHIWQLVIDGLSGDFPPISSFDNTPNNLPTRVTTFLGREAEIIEVGDLLSAHRMLTLTGPGGTGKTRLSLEVAARSLRHFPDGVYFVELSTIREPSLVPATIAQALGIPDRGGRSVVERLVDQVGEKRILLVLDNFEQVVEAASTIQELLASCPHLSVLTSSRSALQVSGEQEYPVPPLRLPDPARLPSLEQLSQYEAVALFIERARAVKPGFDVTNENAPAVAEICVRLDGLPLAIELAAARIRILTPQAMLSRLDDRLGLLVSGSRDLPERQRTLRGAISWSHDMLDETDRGLFACLSVFVGGASLDAIEEVCAGEVTGEVLDALASLVEKSLVRQSEGVEGEPRFSMLETIREFAIEQANARGRTDELRARHAALFVRLAETAAAEVMGSNKRIWLDRLEQDHDNLRASLAWAMEGNRAELAMRTGAALWRFWQMRGYLVEGMERLEQALAMPHSHDHPDARADALSAAAGVAYWLGDERARALYEEEIELRRALGDRAGLADALYGISFTYSIVGLQNPDQAEAAARYVQEARDLFVDLGDEAGTARCEWALANIAYSTRRLDDARGHLRRTLDLLERVDDQFLAGWATYTMGLAELTDAHIAAHGKPDKLAEADRWLRRSLVTFSEAGDVSAYVLVLDALAIVAERTGNRDRAARLSGAVASLERSSGTGLNFWNRALLDFDPSLLRSDPALVEACAAGEQMSAEAAVRYALDQPSESARI